MNQHNNRSSAFYTGATRYGGSSAIAKRREAARRSFFTVTEAPSSSSRSTALNGTNLVHSYTINTKDIIRKEPVAPQLTSQAKRILNWIEESSFAPQETVQLTKRRKTNVRFNPMAYRAPVFKPPILPKKPVENTTKELLPQPAAPSTSATPSPPRLIFDRSKFFTAHKTTNDSVVTASTSIPSIPDRPKLADCSPISEIPPPESSPKRVTRPRDPVPQPVVSAPSVVPSLPKPTLDQSKLFTAPEPVTINSVAAPPPPAPPTSDRFKSANYCGPIKEVPPSFKCSPKRFAEPKDLAPKPVVSTPSVVPSPPKLTFDQSKLFAAPQPVIINSVAAPPPPAPPTSDRFKSANYCGPIKEMPPSFKCSTKKFAEPKDLTPKPVESTQSVAPSKPKPIFDDSKLFTAPKPATVNSVAAPPPSVPSIPDRFESANYCGPTSEITPSFNCNPKKFTELKDLTPQPVVSTLSVAPSLPKVIASPSAAPSPPKVASPGDIEMDVEMDAAAAAVTTTSSSAAPTFSFGAAIQAAPPTQPTPVTPVTSVTPATQTTGSVFMPNFSMPTFTSPVPSPVPPPVVPSPNPLPNGSNPFQPTSSSVRGRKILRPVRRLHR